MKRTNFNLARQTPEATLSHRSSERRLVLLACVGALLLVATAAALAVEHPVSHRDHAAAAAEPAEPVAVKSMSIPDIPLLTQEGRKVRFYTDLVKDRVVAMNFIFTTCTTICPPMGANFARLQRLLGDRSGKDVELISVSVDPAVDTPQRLRAWAEKFGAGPGWTLVTGPKPDVDDLLKALKVFTPDKEDHSPIVLVGNDAEGGWTRVWGLAPPDELARAIERVSSPPGESSASASEAGGTQ